MKILVNPMTGMPANPNRRRCKCKCRRPFRPYGVVGVIPTIKPEKVPLKKSFIKANVTDSVAQIEFTQTYVNKDEAPLECLYKFPIESEFSVTNIWIKMGDKEIETSLEKKEEAE